MDLETYDDFVMLVIIKDEWSNQGYVEVEVDVTFDMVDHELRAFVDADEYWASSRLYENEGFYRLTGGYLDQG